MGIRTIGQSTDQLTPEEREAIDRYIAEHGVTRIEAGRWFGDHEKAMSKFERMKLPPAERKAQAREEYTALVARGFSIKEIAKATGRKHATVRLMLRRYGLIEAAERNEK